MTINTIILSLAAFAFLSPWIFLIIYVHDKRKQEHVWRETLVYLKSATAYEAEDVIDRVHAREKTVVEKGLAKLRKERENLTEVPAADMASVMREDLQKQYGIDTGSGE